MLDRCAASGFLCDPYQSEHETITERAPRPVKQSFNNDLDISGR